MTVMLNETSVILGLKDSKIPGVGYNEKAANRSWQAMLDLFAEVFGIPAKSH